MENISIQIFDVTELQALSSQELIDLGDDLAASDRTVGIQILRVLREVEARMLYARLGFSSLFDYSIRRLKMSRDMAQLRISAMRAMKDVPEIEEKIEAGCLQVSAVSQAQALFRKSVFTVEEKRDIFEQLVNKSVREAQRILAAHSQNPIPPETERVITPNLTQINFTADDELLDKLAEIRELAVASGATYADLFSFMADRVLKELKKKHGGAKAQPNPSVGTHLPDPLAAHPTVTPGGSAALRFTRYTRKKDRADLWQRAQGQCEFVDDSTGTRCLSRFRLQRDHIEDFALGGKTELANLRLYCPTHNRLHALDTFGREKMRQYVGSLS